MRSSVALTALAAAVQVRSQATATNVVSEAISIVDGYASTVLPSYISEEAPALVSELSAVITQYAPTARVSDVPALVSSAELLIGKMTVQTVNLKSNRLQHSRRNTSTPSPSHTPPRLASLLAS